MQFDFCLGLGRSWQADWQSVVAEIGCASPPERFSKCTVTQDFDLSENATQCYCSLRGLSNRNCALMFISGLFALECAYICIFIRVMVNERSVKKAFLKVVARFNAITKRPKWGNAYYTATVRQMHCTASSELYHLRFPSNASCNSQPHL
jgi:hypothetical protein